MASANNAAAPERSINLNINHLAISVPNIEEAVAWYTTNLGFTRIAPNYALKRDASVPDDVETGPFAVYGPALKEVRVAFLTSGNVGIELFEPVDPPYAGPRTPTFGPDNWTRGGCYHIAITHPEPEALCGRLVEAGGRRVGPTMQVSEGYSAQYVQDPWGTVWEICSRSFVEFMTLGADPREFK